MQLPYGTGAQQATQDYALQASFLRIMTSPAIPRLSNNQEDDSGTGWKVMLSIKARFHGFVPQISWRPSAG